MFPRTITISLDPAILMKAPSIAVMTERKRRTLAALRRAAEFCGYDFDEIFRNKTRQRTYADLRSIVWMLYQDELKYSAQQIGIDFGWNRATVFCAINRGRELKSVDKNFADIYDSVASAYQSMLANEEAEANGDN